MNIAQAFKKHFDGYTWMANRHQKAAKKKRIQKKWRRRFGPPISEIYASSNCLLSNISNYQEWSGQTLFVPKEFK